MTKLEKEQLDILSAYMNSALTEEQEEFASDFTDSTISFSDPGTGKTHTTVAGLIMAQTLHGVPGSDIFTMSFTKEATGEAAARYSRLCKSLGMSPTVNFGTFHSLSRRIMADAYPNIARNIKGSINYVEDTKTMSSILERLGHPNASDMMFARNVLLAILNLNSALVFNPKNLVETYRFQKLGIDVETFQKARKRWFMSRLIDESITQGDIPIYCLYAMVKKPEVKAKWYNKYKVMVVDEFQDLSLLHLKILSLIAKTLVVIGDVKQRIYGFNGACPQIVDEYKKMYPSAQIKNLTQSFRCKNEIVDFAKKIIAPNRVTYGEKMFEGVGPGGSVVICNRREVDWEKLFKEIKEDQEKNTISKARKILFLYRNNASATPIIEELYANGVPYRCSKFKMIMELPIFKQLCIMADAAESPYDVNKVSLALKMCPEFQKLTYGELPPPCQLMQRLNMDVFTIPYEWSDPNTREVVTAIRRANIAITQGKNASIVLNYCLTAFDQYIIKGRWWQFDQSLEWYMALVAPIVQKKTYKQMVYDEYQKKQRNESCIAANMGIRCYTMHTAKGLEADDVYILDADEGMFPNAKELQRMLDYGCQYDAASVIQDERNLLFVAVTRAKEHVTITFNDEPTQLLVSPEENDYTPLDDVFFNHSERANDMETFYELFRLDEQSGSEVTG